jgi:hypothetical protein
LFGTVLVEPFAQRFFVSVCLSILRDFIASVVGKMTSRSSVDSADADLAALVVRCIAHVQKHGKAQPPVHDSRNYGEGGDAVTASSDYTDVVLKKGFTAATYRVGSHETSAGTFAASHSEREYCSFMVLVRNAPVLTADLAGRAYETLIPAFVHRVEEIGRAPAATQWSIDEPADLAVATRALNRLLGKK